MRGEGRRRAHSSRTSLQLYTQGGLNITLRTRRRTLPAPEITHPTDWPRAASRDIFLYRDVL